MKIDVLGDGTYVGSFSNSCDCSHDCDCWGIVLEGFSELTEHLFLTHRQLFQVFEYPKLSGIREGQWSVRTPEELLGIITPSRSDWRLEIMVDGGHLEGLVYCQDFPNGKLFSVWPVPATTG
jgi:hypothetical protein